MDGVIDKGVTPPPPRIVGITALLRTFVVGDSKLIDSPNAPAIAYRIFGKGNYRSHKERGGIRIWRVR